MTSSESPSRQRFRHVPTWLGRRYPLIAALEDNPLYLRLRGRAYCRRGMWRGTTGLWGVATSRMTLMVLGLLLAGIPFGLSRLGFSPLFFEWAVVIGCAVAVAGSMRPWREGSNAWRSEARAGRLQDLYMSMPPPDIVDAVVGARFLSSWFGWIATFVCALAAGCAAMTASVAAQTTFWRMIFGLLAIVALNFCLMTPAALYTQLLSVFDNTTHSIRAADRFRTPPEQAMTGMPTTTLWKIAVGGVIIFTTFFGLLGLMAGMHPVAIGIVCVLPSILASSMALNAIFAGENITALRRDAIAAVRRHLAGVVEKNPPATAS